MYFSHVALRERVSIGSAIDSQTFVILFRKALCSPVRDELSNRELPLLYCFANALDNTRLRSRDARCCRELPHLVYISCFEELIQFSLLEGSSLEYTREE